MAHATRHLTLDAIKTKLETLMNSGGEIPRDVLQAAQALIAALDYNDTVLMRSSMNAVFEACRGVFNEAVQKRLGSAQRLGQGLQEVFDMLANRPRENQDELRTAIETLLDKEGKSLTDLLAGPALVLGKHGYPVEGVPQLEQEIQELWKLKRRTLDAWPHAQEELPRVNRSMVAAARAAIARGETGEPIDDLIRRLTSTPDAVP